MAQLEHNDTDRRVDPRESADRLLYGIDVDHLSFGERIELAKALIALAQVDEDRNRNMINLYGITSDEDEQGQSDRKVLRNVLRYRVRVLPALRRVVDGAIRNGGR
jgi:hypothetical protein